MVSIVNQGNEYVCMVLTVLGEGHAQIGSNVFFFGSGANEFKFFPEMVIGVVISVFYFSSHMKIAG